MTYCESNAPWNGSDEITAYGTINVNICLVKNLVEVETSDVEEDEDEDGRHILPARNADWDRAYEESEFSIPRLLDKLAKIAKEKCDGIKSEMGIYKDYQERQKLNRELAYWCNVLENSQGWTIEQLECERS